MPAIEAVTMALGVCHGVSACHVVGIIHRDLKPANVFLANTAHYGTVAKVLDFGVAKPVRYRLSDLTAPGTLVGTPRYLSPEQLKGAEADELSDQYGIGLLLHAALIGKPPFAGKQGKDLIQAILSAEYPRPTALRAELPAPLEAVVLKASNADRTQRYPSVLHLGRALLPFIPAEERTPWAESFSSREPRVPAAAAATVVMTTEAIDELAQKSLDDQTTKVGAGRSGDRQKAGGVVVPVAPFPEDPQLLSSTQIDSSVIPETREPTRTHADGLISVKPSWHRASRRPGAVAILLLAAAGLGIAGVAVLVLGRLHSTEIEVVAPRGWATVTLEDDQPPKPDGGLRDDGLAQGNISRSATAGARRPSRLPGVGGSEGKVAGARRQGTDRHPGRLKGRW